MNDTRLTAKHIKDLLKLVPDDAVLYGIREERDKTGRIHTQELEFGPPLTTSPKNQ